MTQTEPGDPRNDARMARRFAWAFGLIAALLVAFLMETGAEWRDAMKSVLARGGRLRAIHYGHWGVWWGCAVDALICVALALTSRWWAASPPARTITLPTVQPTTRRAWIGLIAILAVAGALRWERASLSFYNDEAHSFRRYIGGQHLRQDDGTVAWRQVTWAETIWLNKVANNSVTFSTLSRLSYDLWRKASGAAEGELGERAVRLPAVLAGMGGLVVLWLLLRRMLPGTAACWWVAALVALHPWHVRYSSEARGHGHLLLGVPLSFWFLQRALEDDRWRWWIGMGLAQCFCACSFAGAISFLAAFNGLLLACLAWRACKGQEEWRRLTRPLAGMTIGGLVTLPVMLPILEQLIDAMKVLDSLQGRMGAEWWDNVVSLLGGGLPWGDLDPGNAENLALSRIISAHPWVWMVVAAALLPFFPGVWRTFRLGISGKLVLLAGPLAAIGMWALMSEQGKLLYLWYVLFVLPGLLIVWAAGADALTCRVRLMAARVIISLLLLLPVAGFAWTDAHLIFKGKENLRGVARAVPAGALHGALFSDVDLYDADVLILHNLSELDGLIEKSRAAKNPLYVSFSQRNDDPMFQEFYKRVGDATLFEQVAIFPGQEEPQFTHYLYRLR